MRIDALPPFKITPEPDGTTHAVREEIQITVLPDVEHKIKHRVGMNAKAGSVRWCMIDLEGGIKLFVNGSHVVITKRDLNPTFNVDG